MERKKERKILIPPDVCCVLLSRDLFSCNVVKVWILGDGGICCMYVRTSVLLETGFIEKEIVRSFDTVMLNRFDLHPVALQLTL